MRALAVCDPKPPEHAKVVIAMIGAGSQIERISAIRASLDVPMTSRSRRPCSRRPRTTARRSRRGLLRARHRRVKDAIPLIEKAIPQEKVQDMKAIAQGALAILKDPAYSGPGASELLGRLLID